MALHVSRLGPVNHLGEILLRTAMSKPEATAVIYDEHRLTFLQVAVLARRLSVKINREGVGENDKVALVMANSPGFSIAYFAALWSGATVVPLNPQLTFHEIVEILSDSRPVVLLADSQLECSTELERHVPILLIDQAAEMEHLAESWELAFADFLPSTNQLLADLAHRDPEESALILYTSGSTGSPKGVELSHRCMLHNAISVAEEKFSTGRVANYLQPGDVALAALPLSHVFGLTNVQNGAWVRGAAISYMKKFSPTTAVKQLIRDRVTFFPGVPTMFFELVESIRQISDNGDSSGLRKRLSLKYAVCGGASLSANLKESFATLTGARIQESYGMTETSPMVACQKIDETEKIGVVGKPISGVEVRIVDAESGQAMLQEIGEIWVRGECLFNGYHEDPEATQEAMPDDWFRTGDLGRWDSDGDLEIVGRSKEVIKRGGYAIFPQEIEKRLLAIPWIQEAAVVPVPDDRLGEEIKAYIVPDPSYGLTRMNTGFEQDSKYAECLSAIEVECQSAMANYKRPRLIELVVELPKGPTGKIARQELIELARNERSS